STARATRTSRDGSRAAGAGRPSGGARASGRPTEGSSPSRSDGGELGRREPTDVHGNCALARDAGDRLEVALGAHPAAGGAAGRADLAVALGRIAVGVGHRDDAGPHVARRLRDAVDEVVVRVDADDVARMHADALEVVGMEEGRIVWIAAPQPGQV